MIAKLELTRLMGLIPNTDDETIELGSADSWAAAVEDLARNIVRAALREASSPLIGKADPGTIEFGPEFGGCRLIKVDTPKGARVIATVFLVEERLPRELVSHPVRTWTPPAFDRLAS